jgi:hypothetical protein
MSSTSNNFHHIGLVSKNLDSLTRRYEQLGFTFTPLSIVKIPLKPGAEPEILGAGNRCAIFQNSYLELLGITDRDRWERVSKAQRGPYDLDAPLSRYEGLHVMHFASDDLEAFRERLLKQGTLCSEIGRFQRNVDTPDGERTMHARTLHFPQGSNPEGLIQIAQHLTPELVLQPRYMQHPNGAQMITEVIVCVADPAEFATKYKRYSGRTGALKGNIHIVDLGHARITIVAPEHLDEIIPGCIPPTLPFLAGFTIATADLDVARQLWTQNHIPFQEYDGRLLVQAEDAGGSTVIFENAGKTRLSQ